MAITIDPATKVISIPQADLALLSGTLYSADTNQIRKDVNAILASEDGIWMPDAFIHNTTVTLFGVTYARTLEYIAPYSITFTPDSQWSARLEGSNNNMGDVEAGILNQNQVQVIPTNSAGLIDLEILTSSAYQGRVVVSPMMGQAGTTKPIGTFERPVDNMTDALTIAIREGIDTFYFLESLTISTGDFSTGYNFLGSSPANTLTILAAANVSHCNFKNTKLTGALDGVNLVDKCSCIGITGLSGFAEKCDFSGTTTFSGDCGIFECYSGTPNTPTPVFETGTSNIIFRDWHGNIEIGAMTAGTIVLEVYGGGVTFNAGCTGGTAYCRGATSVPTTVSGTCTVVDETIPKGMTVGDFLALK